MLPDNPPNFYQDCKRGLDWSGSGFRQSGRAEDVKLLLKLLRYSTEGIR